MRVISGSLKGREIKGYNIKGTRPTMGRVKESIFSIIQNNLTDNVVLDLFCGSGQYGIESISNGCKYCYFVDNNKEVFNVLKQNINLLGIQDQSKLLLMDYKKSLSYFKNNNIKFDIIFIDPPYDYIIIDNLINLIEQNCLLNNKGLLIVEYQKDILKSHYYNNISLIRKKRYSDKFVNIYEKTID